MHMHKTGQTEIENGIANDVIPYLKIHQHRRTHRQELSVIFDNQIINIRKRRRRRKKNKKTSLIINKKQKAIEVVFRSDKTNRKFALDLRDFCMEPRYSSTGCRLDVDVCRDNQSTDDVCFF